MRLRPAPLALLVLVGLLAVAVWRAQLFTVAAPGVQPRALVRLATPRALEAPLALSLPSVPVGRLHLESGRAVQVVHFWAPWEQHALRQAQALDSLLALRPGSGLRAALVCFDPYPSVARWLRRTRVRTPVALDHSRALAPLLPCPSIPYTYVLDARGRIVVAQSGEVDWLAPATQRLLDSLTGAVDRARPPQAETASERPRPAQRMRSAWPPKSTAV